MADQVQATTQSKYKKKKKDETVPQIEANEVRIKGNQGHVKRYVDYACGLLEGDSPPRNKHKEEDKDKTDKDDGDNEEQKEPIKFDTIVLKATGRAINKAVTTAEVVKRRVRGLHQVTSLETLEITDVWEPLEQGLKEVETKRRVASITITLSRAEKDIDKNAAGYQPPISADAIKPFSNYSGYNRNNRRKGRNFNRRGGWNRRGGGYGGGYNRRGGGGYNRRRGGYGGYNRRGGYRGGGSPNRSPGGYGGRRGRGGYGGGGYGGGGYRRGGYGGGRGRGRY